VTPSDHLIKDEVEYKKVLDKARELANEDTLVTFGITPTFAETGFGYIQAEPENDECSMLNVECFKEKPDSELAEQYLKENSTLSIQNLPLKWYWNSGMFMFRAGCFLEELKTHAPEIYDTCKLAFDNKIIQNCPVRKYPWGTTLRIQHSYMEAIPSESIDYAVMEKSNKVKVIPSNIDWSDLGSFESLDEEIPSSDNVININASNNLILSSKQVAAIDIEDLIIIDTADALLVSKKGSSQKVKEVVKQLKEQNSSLPNIHVTAHRPWGTYTILDESDGYKVKRIVVKPGKRLSLQKHHHRSEHWIVVSGTAVVTRGAETYTVNANESTYIPIGEVHRLENVGKIPLVMIEAQVGEYVGEDDIVRLEDDFKRTVIVNVDSDGVSK
jgi:mannose-1-phosphate guanylyltransferase